MRGKIDFMSRVLSDWCALHDIDLKSADDILQSDTLIHRCTIYTELTSITLECEHKLNHDQKEWLKNYIDVWETLNF